MTAPAPRSFTITAVAAMLSKSVGDDVALASVTEAVARLSLPGDELSEADALALFATIADGEGVIAVAARFIRSRLIAQFSREHLEQRAK